MRLRMLGAVGFFTFALVSIQALQDTNSAPAPLRQTPVGAGAEMFLNYCASCHGRDGTGSGPTSTALRARTTNLTTLAERNGGKFPAERVKATIRGDLLVLAHGSKDMPVWGPVLRYLGGGSRAEANVRIDNLTRYIESLQASERCALGVR
jgi:mono/diheme cytochrome c family protein